jgi:superfamily II helicase
LSTSPGTSSSPVAFLFLIFLMAFSTSLCKIYGTFLSVSTSSSGSTSRVSGRLGWLIRRNLWGEYDLDLYQFRKNVMAWFEEATRNLLSSLKTTGTLSDKNLDPT